MAKQFYYRFIISNLSEADEDVVSSICFDYGAEGVSENLDFEQLDREYNTKTLDKKIKTIEAYFSTKPNNGALSKKIQSLNKNIKTQMLKEPAKDWMSEWKKGFVPFELTNNIWVVPSWLKAPQQSEFNIFIDPGMAFGTGTHETTQIAADLLVKLSQISPNLKTLIDVGTGTGILAILASHLGFDKITGTEIDEDARLVGIENCQLNNVSVTIPSYQVEKVKESFEVVVANIIDGVLVRIQQDLKRCCTSYMLLTGILEERESLFLNEFEMQDFKVLKRLQKNEWVGFLLERK